MLYLRRLSGWIASHRGMVIPFAGLYEVVLWSHGTEGIMKAETTQQYKAAPKLKGERSV